MTPGPVSRTIGAVTERWEVTMALLLNSVNVYNDNTDAASYRLIIMDGDKIVRRTNAISPTQFDGLSALKIPITGSLTLVAEKV